MPRGTIPALGHGGIVMRPRLARIAEAGPEAVVPLSGGGGGFGGLLSMDAVVERLDRMDRTLFNLPVMIAKAIVPAVQMA